MSENEIYEPGQHPERVDFLLLRTLYNDTVSSLVGKKLDFAPLLIAESNSLVPFSDINAHSQPR